MVDTAPPTSDLVTLSAEESSDYPLDPIPPPAPALPQFTEDVSPSLPPLDPLVLRMLRVSMRLGRVFLLLASVMCIVGCVVGVQNSVEDIWPSEAMSCLGNPYKEPASSGWYNGALIVVCAGMLIHNIPLLVWVTLRPPLPPKTDTIHSQGDKWYQSPAVRRYLVLPPALESVLWRVVAWFLLLDFAGLMASGFLNGSFGRVHREVIKESAGLAILALLLMFPLNMHSGRALFATAGVTVFMLTCLPLGDDHLGVMPYAVFEMWGLVGMVGIQYVAGYSAVEWARGGGVSS
ncbi:hypothetical protein KIPB_004913 [Kipferlia bialata]|uniref:Uncharacterized protein n=1 Tax=Kipferlia bialata TaxID=797122 RepID=A0A9K3CUI5_9EUKA|nr:hypothetical protein KIPB_004913 [Kipferlia bialata]|eukprot:g4913.t1